MKTLVIEDDPKIASFVSTGLKQAGFEVDTALDGEEGLALALRVPYELLVLDLMLPRIDGLKLIETIRSKGVSSKILILSAKRSVDDRVLGLQHGGDDYLTKPFAFSELLARCQALLRRSANPASPSQINFEDLTLNLLTREVLRDGQKLDLQVKEFSLLEYFMRNPGVVLSKTQILERIWNYNFDPQTNVVDVLVCRLRNKVDKDYPTKLIHTIRGIGYVFKSEA